MTGRRPADPRRASCGPSRVARALTTLLAAVVLSAGLVTVDAGPVLAATPSSPTGLPPAVEDIQPYLGQEICDPVAKPGVVAFRNLLLHVYPGTGSLGIVRDCGVGGQSEHKEGRAFDWQVSYANGTQRAQVAALLGWLLKDSGGQRDVMMRRLGIMYIIWHRQIYKAYDDRGWEPYDGESAHNDHVHFSFGWNGARKLTSYWTGHVAPIDFGPRPPAQVTPVRRPSNLSVLHSYGRITLKLPATGAAVTLAQRALRTTADGDFGGETTAAVARFEVDHHLPAVQHVGPAEWLALFPKPVIPFGVLDQPDGSTSGSMLDSVVSGWALDADTTGPVTVRVLVDGALRASAAADVQRADVDRIYPDFGGAHGYSVSFLLLTGSHTICVEAVNSPGTPGGDSSLGCRSVTVGTDPVGAVEQAAQELSVVHVSGFAADPQAAGAVPVSLSLDGASSDVVPRTVARPDLGGGVGWSADLPADDGLHVVCVLSGQTTLGCRSVTVSHAAVATLSSLVLVQDGVRASGLALDPDVAEPALVVLTVDGEQTLATVAASERADVLPRWSTLGSRHGFDQFLALEAGRHQVCATALNAAGTPGADSAASCTVVDVP